MKSDYPCSDCEMSELCDHYTAQFCCRLCEHLGCDDCDNCDPGDI